MRVRPVICTLWSLAGSSPGKRVLPGDPNPPKTGQSGNRLHLTRESVGPGFKLLLFPQTEGQPLAMTKWNTTRDTVSISWADPLHFAIGDDGRTHVEIRREGGDTAKLQ